VRRVGGCSKEMEPPWGLSRVGEPAPDCVVVWLGRPRDEVRYGPALLRSREVIEILADEPLKYDVMRRAAANRSWMTWIRLRPLTRRS